MKKVININFQGRVIPIEETAHDLLKKYVESLRIFFANEEGRDEIINDIEGRIAELFGDRLKKGSTCITDDDVNSIIANMGRPEDFEAEESNVQSQLLSGSQSSNTKDEQRTSVPRGRLYRSINDKLIGGVCAGVANYLRVDPTIVRLLFAVITFGGFGMGFLIYIVLWIILPAKTLDEKLKKRLYRNPDEKVVGGVASGLAAYFNVQTWIPRLVFALPLVLGIISSIFQNAFFEFDPFPAVIFGSFGSTLFVIYLILWVVIPQAQTASEKLEMRGEKVDLNSIKNSIKEEMEGLRGRAEKAGTEFKENASAWASEATPVARRTGSRLLNAIGILFKAFFLFISGIIVFAMLMALLGIMIGGVSVFPLKNFLLEGFWQNFLAWSTLILFLGVPVIGFITWLIRRLIGVRSKNKYLGFTFGGLWTIGIITAILLAASIARDFSSMAREKMDYTIAQPASNKISVKVAEENFKVYGRWFNMDGLLSITDDSVYLNRVKLRIVKSPDSGYHAYAIKSSNGRNDGVALDNAKAISYEINQQDSMIYLSRGFALKKGTRFRNQAVVVTLQVPVGKRIMIDKSVSRKLKWFDTHHRNRDWDEDWDGTQNWQDNVEYIMTVGGLERVDGKDENGEERSPEEMKRELDEQLRDLREKRRELEEATDELDPEPAPPRTINNIKSDFTNPMNSVLRFIE